MLWFLYHIKVCSPFLKGQFTQKKKKSVFISFSHPQVVQNLYEFLLLDTKEDILKNVGNQTVVGLH